MKPQAILELVRKASLFEIFIISFFLLPFIAKQWIEILEKLQWSTTSGLIAMLVAYVLGIALMFVGSRRTVRRETACDGILGYLAAKGFTMMSHDRIRERINSGYDDAMLDALPQHFPQVLRRAKLKGGRRGLGRIVVEKDATEE